MSVLIFKIWEGESKTVDPMVASDVFAGRGVDCILCALGEHMLDTCGTCIIVCLGFACCCVSVRDCNSDRTLCWNEAWYGMEFAMWL